jgi:hypothetical protein
MLDMATEEVVAVGGYQRRVVGGELEESIEAQNFWLGRNFLILQRLDFGSCPYACCESTSSTSGRAVREYVFG